MVNLSIEEEAVVAAFVERPGGRLSLPTRGLRADARHSGGDDPLIEIVLVNNMPDAALRRTERQFMRLVEAAAGPTAVRVRMCELPGLSRGETYRNYTRSAYHDLAAIMRSPSDGLIVTGTEPRAADLADEPYWPAFTRLVDWAAGNTLATYWSCLAAHAAVQHLTGIRRRRLPSKLSGVYTCEAVGGHPLTAGMGATFPVPHSRYNGLDPAAIEAAGYRMLSRSDRVPVDMFLSEGQSLFLFAQGHPEYDTNSLLKEYRRDARRFLAGERDDMPMLPEGYLSSQAEQAFEEFAHACRSDRRPETASRLPFLLAESTIVNAWYDPAVALFRNWLDSITERKRATGHATAVARAATRS